jgi:triphosphoribosyl-dephospho-CoA synthase
MRSGEAPAALRDDLLQWDARLKAQGINPGTSADLTVATVFAHRLRTILPSARNSD